MHVVYLNCKKAGKVAMFGVASKPTKENGKLESLILTDIGLFLQEVKIGSVEVFTASIDLDDSLPQPSLSSSPPQQPVSNVEKAQSTPPNSPNVSGVAPFIGLVYVLIKTSNPLTPLSFSANS